MINKSVRAGIDSLIDICSKKIDPEWQHTFYRSDDIISLRNARYALNQDKATCLKALELIYASGIRNERDIIDICSYLQIINDAVTHNLDYKRAKADYRISDLYTKYRALMKLEALA